MMALNMKHGRDHITCEFKPDEPFHIENVESYGEAACTFINKMIRNAYGSNTLSAENRRVELLRHLKATMPPNKSPVLFKLNTSPERGTLLTLQWITDADGTHTSRIEGVGIPTGGKATTIEIHAANALDFLLPEFRALLLVQCPDLNAETPTKKAPMF